MSVSYYGMDELNPTTLASERIESIVPDRIVEVITTPGGQRELGEFRRTSRIVSSPSAPFGSLTTQDLSNDMICVVNNVNTSRDVNAVRDLSSLNGVRVTTLQQPVASPIMLQPVTSTMTSPVISQPVESPRRVRFADNVIISDPIPSPQQVTQQVVIPQQVTQSRMVTARTQEPKLQYVSLQEVPCIDNLCQPQEMRREEGISRWYSIAMVVELIIALLIFIAIVWLASLIYQVSTTTIALIITGVVIAAFFILIIQFLLSYYAFHMIGIMFCIIVMIMLLIGSGILYSNVRTSR